MIILILLHMELSNIISNEDGKDLSFDIKNLDIPYLNGITRIIMSEIPSYAFDHLNVINNTSTINNDKIKNKILMIPIDKPIAFTINVKNTTDLLMHVTSSDMKFYKLNDPEFQEYLNGLDKKILHRRIREYKNQGIDVNDMEINEVDKTYVDEDLAVYLDKHKNDSEIDISNVVQENLQITILDVGEELELYGVSIPGIPKDHVKWQQGFAFKQQKKNVIISDTFVKWDDKIESIIEDLKTIKTKDDYNKNKYIDLLFHVLNMKNGFDTFQQIKWTKSIKQTIQKETKQLIENMCGHIYNMDLKEYNEYQRCIPCIEKVAHLLKIESTDIYKLEKLPEYSVTIESNTRKSSLIWNQAISIFIKKIEDLLKNIEYIVGSNLTVQESGYILKLNNISYTLANIIVHEMRKESKISLCSYRNTHPLNEYIEIYFKWKKEVTNPQQNTTNILKQILNRSKMYINKIPLIDQIN